MATTWRYPVLHDVHDRPIVVSVTDGDTFAVVLDQGTNDGSFPDLRVAGVWCPERRQPGGPEARAWTLARLESARSIWAHLLSRSFARWVAQVDVDGVDLAQQIIAAGHGTAERTKT